MLGSNEYGQLGQSTDNANQSIGDQPNEMETLQPINFGTGRFALEIAGGEDFACARLDDDTVKCWGLNTSGQLGQDNTIRAGHARRRHRGCARHRFSEPA